MDIIEIEREFVRFIAEKTNLIVDKNIFRGGIPHGVPEGVGVIFGAEIKLNTFYGFRPQAWNVQIIGKYAERDVIISLQNILNQIVPCYDIVRENINFASIEANGNSEPYITSDDGKEKYCVSFNCILTVIAL